MACGRNYREVECMRLQFVPWSVRQFSESISDDCVAAYLRLGTLRFVQRSHAGQIQTFGSHFWSKLSGQYNSLNGWHICVGMKLVLRYGVQTDDA